MAKPKSSLLALRDKPSPAPTPIAAEPVSTDYMLPPAQANPPALGRPPSRQGRKAITGYFSPEMSFAMHDAARRNGMSLQAAMADAFNDWLRKMGSSPVGE